MEPGPAGDLDRPHRADHRADRRVPDARPPDGRHRPAAPPAAQAPRPRHPEPRPHAVGPRPRVPGRRVRGPGRHEAARHPRGAPRLLLPDHRRRVHAHPRPREARLAPGAHRGAARAGAGRRAEVHPLEAQRRRGVRGVPADQVRRAEALLARGRGDGHPAARRGARRGRGPRDGRGRHRHAAPRQAQRARQHRRQAGLADLPRVRGQPRPGPGARLRRREVPPGRRGQVLPDVRRRRDHGVADVEPVAPRGRRPGARGHRAGQAGPARQGPRRLHRPARRHARRRRVRGPGRGRRDAEPGAAARLPHRRHRARDRQQPGRLHHRPGAHPLDALLHRRGEDDRRAGLPRERRRPGGLRLGGAPRGGVPRAVELRRRDRHDLLPAPRPQRGRRPLDDPARDVRRHRRQALGPQDLHRVAHRAWRHLARRGRARAARLRQPARARVQRGPRAGEGAGRSPARRSSGSRRSRPPCRPRCRSTSSSASPGAFVDAPRGLHRAPARQAGARAPRQGRRDRHRGGHRLGVRRAAGLRLAAHRRQARPALRAGHPPRHVRAAALGDHRPAHRRGVRAAAQPHRRPGPVHGLRLGAVRVRRGRLRVRLLGGEPQRAGGLGGPVRRLRQRRPVDHRRVHLVR